MKLFGSSLLGQALAAAGVGAALMLSATQGYAQAGGPFAGFDGNWSGTGTVLSVQGKPMGRPIAGEDFYRALLRIWLGDKPVQDDLKKALLGG